MANDLFTKEDFVKKGKVSNPWYKNWKILTPSALVLAVASVIGISQFNSSGGNGQTHQKIFIFTIDSVTKKTPIITPDSLTVTEEIGDSINEEAEKDISKTVNKTGKIESANTNISKTSDSHFDNVEEEALSVIRGNYGNNPERRRLLKERYQEIQNKVNEMYRNGQVK